jgi:drug/metabolite transporter (DMT)-like permease
MTTDRYYTGGLLLAMLAMLCMSFAPVFIKLGLAEAIEPVTLLMPRLLMAAAALWVVYLLFWPGQLRIDRKGLIGCAAVAAANSTSMLCMYLALTRIDASIAFMVFALHPLVVLLLLTTQGERITRLSLVRLGLAILGVYLLIGPSGQVDLVGVLLALVTTAAYALHITLTQWYLSEYPPQTVTLYVVSLIALIITAIRLLQFKPWQPISLAGWGVILGAALIATVFARLALFAAIRRIGSGQMALFGPAETLMIVLWSFLFLGERLSPVQWGGGLFILVSVMLVVRRRARVVAR